MITLGVDLAAQDKKTAGCKIRWESGTARVEDLFSKLSDPQLLDLAGEADRVGIDIPFGWPDAFVDFVHAHKTFQPLPSVDRRDLCYRKTDLFVAQQIGKKPLSVSTNLIGVPALRAAALFDRLHQQGEKILRDGLGKFVEVYPSAALIVWGLEAKRYKGKKGREARIKLVQSLLNRTSTWLQLEGRPREEVQEDDNALDALVAALVARAAALGLCLAIPGDCLEEAQREGWIALPKADSLEELSQEALASSTRSVESPTNMQTLGEYIERASVAHGHTCAGQILGIRLALLGLRALGIDDPVKERKRLVTIVEIDRCATDAVQLVTGCRLGKRALKFKDFGKVAATFVDLKTHRALRVVAREESKEKAREMYPKLDKEEAQRRAYRELPDEELFSRQWVRVELPPEELPGFKAPRAVCAECGEGINFKREVVRDGRTLCRGCAGERYYEPLSD